MHNIILLKVKIKNEFRLLALQSIVNKRFYVREMSFYGISRSKRPLEMLTIKTALIISS